MPNTLTVRRDRAFRPTRYSERHAQVAALLAAGLRRREVARITGYSCSHVSRIARMPEARRDIIEHLGAQAMKMMDDFSQTLEQPLYNLASNYAG